MGYMHRFIYVIDGTISIFQHKILSEYNIHILRILFPSLSKAQGLLIDLDLSKNEVKQIRKSTFHGLEKLEYLNLSNNKIEEIEDLAFEQLCELQELYLNNNRIKKLGDKSLHGLGALTILNLAKNVLSEIPTQALRRMRRNDGSDYQSLIELNLSGNNITKIKDESFKFTNKIEILDLRENPGKLSENSFQNLSYLSILDISDMNVSVIPDRLFYHISSVRELRFDKNKIEQINEDTFAGLKQLQTLSISWNPKLREIDSKAFQQNQNLSKIEISHNKALSDLPKKLFNNLPKLKYLDLRDNHLSHVELPEKQSWQNIFLSNNPWSCDCDLMSVYLVTKNISCGKPSGISFSRVNMDLCELKENILKYKVRVGYGIFGTFYNRKVYQTRTIMYAATPDSHVLGTIFF